MAFLTVLNEDVIARILSVCDIPTVLSTSQTCKYLHSLAFSKYAWLAHITKMQRRITLDVPRGVPLQSLPTTSLIELAKRALRGPRSWAPSLPESPVVNRRHILHLPDLNTDVIRLLPGGKFLIRKQPTNLECWNVQEDERIWHYSPNGNWHSFRILRFAEDVIKGGDAVILMICLSLSLPTGNTQSVIEIVNLDLLAGSSELLHSVESPRRPFEYEFYHPRICGDIAAVGLHFASQILIINWRSGCYIKLPISSNIYDLDIIPGHLIVIEGSRTGGACVVSVFGGARLARFWRSRLHPPSQHAADTISPLFRESVGLPSARSPLQTLLAAHAHPFYDDTYVVWAFATSAIPNFPGRSAGSSIAVSYRIALNRSTGALQLHKASAEQLTQGFHDLGWCGFSFSGHALVSTSAQPRTQNTILHLGELSKYADDTDKAKFPNAQHISAYSGALTYPVPENDTVIVEYYD